MAWVEGKPFEEIMQDKIKEVEDKEQELIIEKYPLQKQIDIASSYQGYTETDKQTMNDYKLAIRQQSDTFKAEIEAKKTIDEIKNYTFEYTIPK